MTDRTREEGYRFDDPDHQRYWAGVLEACELLRGHYSGSSDGFPDEARDDMVAFLKYRLEHWTVSTRSDERYDEAVRQVMLAIMEMSRRDFFERGEVKVLVEVQKKTCGNCQYYGYRGSKTWCFLNNGGNTSPGSHCMAWSSIRLPERWREPCSE